MENKKGGESFNATFLNFSFWQNAKGVNSRCDKEIPFRALLLILLYQSFPFVLFNFVCLRACAKRRCFATFDLTSNSTILRKISMEVVCVKIAGTPFCFYSGSNYVPFTPSNTVHILYVWVDSNFVRRTRTRVSCSFFNSAALNVNHSRYPC